MQIRELMSSNICFIREDSPVSDAVDLMKKNNIGFIPVCDNRNCPVGLITDRDILMRTAAMDDAPLSSISAGQIMTDQVTSIPSDMNIHDAALIFSQKKVRRLPVSENGRLVGVVSLSDLAKKKILLAEVGSIMGAIAKEPSGDSFPLP